MKLVLYSGGATAANRALHQSLADITGERRRKSLTYIPFCAAGALPFFRRFERRYRPYGFTDFVFFPVDLPFSKVDLDRALASDAIYLAGGNTFYFLHHLRKRGLLRALRRYAEGGGAIAGLSAGAHILTPDVGLAGYPHFDKDRNDVKLRDLRGLGLVPFEFFPHYRLQRAWRTALVRYSRRRPAAIVAAADGGGVVIEGPSMTFVGRTEIFLAGAHGTLST
jgi:dipeptidase E